MRPLDSLNCLSASLGDMERRGVAEDSLDGSRAAVDVLVVGVSALDASAEGAFFFFFFVLDMLPPFSLRAPPDAAA